MHPSSRSSPLRILALLVILWVSFDIGAHGLFASDFPPLMSAGASMSFGQDARGAGSGAPTDHCFCHGLSSAALMAAPDIRLTPVGTLVLDPPPQVPHSHPHPLDRPPQLAA